MREGARAAASESAGAPNPWVLRRCSLLRRACRCGFVARMGSTSDRSVTSARLAARLASCSACRRRRRRTRPPRPSACPTARTPPVHLRRLRLLWPASAIAFRSEETQRALLSTPSRDLRRLRQSASAIASRSVESPQALLSTPCRLRRSASTVAFRSAAPQALLSTPYLLRSASAIAFRSAEATQPLLCTTCRPLIRRPPTPRWPRRRPHRRT